MDIKMGAFISGFIGVALISAAAFSSMGYGEDAVKEYYANGQLERELNYKNGMLEGSSKDS